MSDNARCWSRGLACHVWLTATSTPRVPVGMWPRSHYDRELAPALAIRTFRLYQVELPEGEQTVRHNHTDDGAEDLCAVIGLVVVDDHEVPVSPGDVSSQSLRSSIGTFERRRSRFHRNLRSADAWLNRVVAPFMEAGRCDVSPRPVGRRDRCERAPAAR